jgi:DNA-3-methyladenine glycosylase
MYVYFTYGMHWCANAVCGDVDEGVGVLIRALEPVAGIEAMRSLRPKARTDRDIASGPGKLAQALGITGALDGADLVEGDRGVRIVTDGTPPPVDAVTGPRIGISQAREHPWRWHVPAHPHVSRKA